MLLIWKFLVHKCIFSEFFLAMVFHKTCQYATNTSENFPKGF
jgi:hypothetical protein